MVSYIVERCPEFIKLLLCCGETILNHLFCILEFLSFQRFLIRNWGPFLSPCYPLKFLSQSPPFFCLFSFLSYCLTGFFFRGLFPFVCSSFSWNLLVSFSHARLHHAWVFLLLLVLWTKAQYVGWCLIINLHQLPGTDEGGRDVTVDGQCDTCCCWRSLNTHMTIAVVQIAP